MNVEVNLSAEDINATISKAIIESAIGKELQHIITEQVKILSRSYDNPIKSVVAREIERVVSEFIQTQYKETIRQHVVAQVTEEFTTDLLDKMWKSFVSKY